jgi:AcrR family transcriptional regulator
MSRLTKKVREPFFKHMVGDRVVSENPAQKRRYHHGDLKSVLVAAGREILEAGGMRALSLREAARRAGVSHAAPAHHFPSLSAFLSECAASGFGEFADALIQARNEAFDAEQAIAGMGRAYLAFAHRNPVIFRLMFDQSENREHTPVQATHGSRAYNVLVEACRDIQPSVTAEELDFRVSAVWSTVHGYADLMLEGQICHETDSPEAVVAHAQANASRALLLLVRGMLQSDTSKNAVLPSPGTDSGLLRLLVDVWRP